MGRATPRIVIALAALGLTTQCSMPHDPERTGEQVRETHTIRLGWVEGTPANEDADAALAALARKYDAQIERRTDDSEQLLEALSDGLIDIVYGEYPADSPWSKEVHLSRAIGWRSAAPTGERVPRFALRNGENGWIMDVEEALRP